MKILAKDKVEALLDKLSQEALVFAPMSGEKSSGFFPWNEESKAKESLLLEALNVYVSPKHVLLPQTERMYDIKQQAHELEIGPTHEDDRPRVLFGVRACDARAIKSLDDVFLTRGFVDSFYQARRDNLTIIGNACYAPGPNCFCQAMGVELTEPEGDIILRDADAGYIWEVKSEKGEKLTTLVAEFLHEQEVSAPAPQPFSLQVDYEGVAEKLTGMFGHPLWESLAEPCINCGACTYICPSCYCFDIQVKMWGDEGYRFRCWDSCMYAEYTAEAGGGNPRPTGVERFRNRFLHKLETFYERYGYSLCTGCGRCIVVCPTGVNITDIIKQIQEVESSE